MPVLPTGVPGDFGDIFPAGVIILGGEPTLELSDDRNAPTMPGFPYAHAKRRGAVSVRATGMQVPASATGSTTAPPSADATVTNAA